MIKYHKSVEVKKLETYRLRILPKKGYEEIYSGHTGIIWEADIHGINQRNWFFPWGEFHMDSNQYVYKLMVNGSNKIQRLISYEYDDGFILVNAWKRLLIIALKD